MNTTTKERKASTDVAETKLHEAKTGRKVGEIERNEIISIPFNNGDAVSTIKKLTKSYIASMWEAAKEGKPMPTMDAIPKEVLQGIILQNMMNVRIVTGLDLSTNTVRSTIFELDRQIM